MTPYRYCLLVVSALAGGALSQPAFATTPADMLAQMDSTAAKYDTPECQAMREKAAKYTDSSAGDGAVSGVVGASFGLLGAAFSAAALAAAAQKRERDFVGGFIESCGEETFIPYFQAKAEKGDEDAATSLARAYEHKQDWAQAIHWYQAAIDRGSATAEARLGMLYMQGNGVPQDRTRAVSMWLHAADHGSNEARANLGQMYAADHDYAKANQWFLKAANRGDGAGAFFLGQASEQGLGVEQNDLAAFGWYSVAWHLHYPGAEEKRSAMAARLRPWQMQAEAKKIDKCLHFNRCEM